MESMQRMKLDEEKMRLEREKLELEKRKVHLREQELMGKLSMQAGMRIRLAVAFWVLREVTHYFVLYFSS